MPAAVAGAALVAFGAPRLNQMSHQQLLPFFYPLLTLYALARLVGDRSMGRRRGLATGCWRWRGWSRSSTPACTWVGS